ncbi:Transposon Tf2-1 polyprotein [Rhizoctonia solani]|uniref:Transposon Tf2-1 polyprotein n=1 Tax=Rhizoctonia solani TaxID=456999 RepID=A0A8H8P3W7_9AGAM|nr:Transposon Tf2-1 polyprotein [Rhizoctonia solani]QRW24000.1 Transposon Tf2-1 polyprotein [Rhizoctonia solani]
MSTQPSTYVHADPNALSVPTNIQEIPAWAQEIKNLLLAMNQNLSLVIGQAAAHHTDIGTTQATLSNHDSSITNLDALIVKLGADIAKIGTAAASGSSLASATKAPKLATPDKFDGSDKNKAISFRVAVSHYLRISYPGSTVDEQIAFIISCLDGKAHEWLEPYLEEDVVKGNPVSWLHNLDAFWLQFNARWNVQNRTENFRAKLRTLKQTKGVQDYYKDFQTYSQGLGYNDPSLRDMFYDGLSHKIKETLMVQDYDHADASVTLATLAEKALKVDQRLEQFAAQHKGSSPSSNQSGSKSSTSTSAAAQGAPRDKLSVGEQVYAIVDGKAKKGVLQKIGQNAKGLQFQLLSGMMAPPWTLPSKLSRRITTQPLPPPLLPQGFLLLLLAQFWSFPYGLRLCLFKRQKTHYMRNMWR